MDNPHLPGTVIDAKFSNQNFACDTFIPEHRHEGVDVPANYLIGSRNVIFVDCVFGCPPDRTEALKISNGQNITFSHCVFGGGIEDCVDVIRSDDVAFIDCIFDAGEDTRRHITAKASGYVAMMSNGRHSFQRERKKCTGLISVGAWSEYDRIKRPRTRFRLDDVKDSAGILCLHGEVHATHGRVLRVPRLLVAALFAARNKGWLGKTHPLPAEVLALKYNWERR